MNKVLLVEDDHNLGMSIMDSLKKEGLDMTLARSIAEAQVLRADTYDVILLDWMLPDGQGIDFLKDLRANNYNTPVIMLTARADLIDKVLGLETGANDYVTKPFELRELIARIRVQLRERSEKLSHGEQPHTQLERGSLVIDTEARKCIYRGGEIVLTKMEFNLLHLLAASPKITFSREKLLDKVWGLDNYPTTRTVDTHVLQLRQKLDSDIIETIRGIGYRFGHTH